MTHLMYMMMSISMMSVLSKLVVYLDRVNLEMLTNHDSKLIVGLRGF